MKATDNRKQIRKDCLSSMRVVTIAQFLVDLSSVLIPTLTASVFGEMTHALLQQAIPLCILMIGIGLTKAGNLPIGAVVTGYSYDAKRLIFNTFRIGFIKYIMNADRNYQIAKVEDRMFGSFIEQQGSCIGNGIYEPTHPAADEGGFRQDVLERTRKLNLSIIRFPGGN